MSRYPLWLLLALVTLASSLPAQPRRELLVWYRSTEGCPDGAAFLQRLTQRKTPARLARVGDRVDFVVTLGTTERGSAGRLERQSERGTVAIREVRGDDCSQVADAIALSLILVGAPRAEASAASGGQPAPDGSADPIRPASPPVESAPGSAQSQSKQAQPGPAPGSTPGPAANPRPNTR